MWITKYLGKLVVLDAGVFEAAADRERSESERAFYQSHAEILVYCTIGKPY
jgi:hypothetical protein